MRYCFSPGHLQNKMRSLVGKMRGGTGVAGHSWNAVVKKGIVVTTNHSQVAWHVYPSPQQVPHHCQNIHGICDQKSRRPHSRSHEAVDLCADPGYGPVM